MGIDFGVICAADFDNAIRLYVRGRQRVTLGRRAGWRTENMSALLNSAAHMTPKLIHITIYLSSFLNFCESAGGG